MEITKFPNIILKNKAKTIDPAEIKAGKFMGLILDMKDIMVRNNGIGLAANQVGQNLSIFVIDKSVAEKSGVPEVYINPEITELSKDTGESEEGCLSIPEYYLHIKRSKKVKIRAYDETGKKIKLKARGLLARIFQHEIDHINGVTIKDKS